MMIGLNIDVNLKLVKAGNPRLDSSKEYFIKLKIILLLNNLIYFMFFCLYKPNIYEKIILFCIFIRIVLYSGNID